ncbi:MAG: hypothetical protein H7312_18775 [Tardiphaga sp.]|jgi:hypothetical protein|nr:hypothetical protein [Tardiphaga sp.]
MPATTDSNLEIAKRANDEARADFATWLMMAKLNSIDALPRESQSFFAGYRALLARRQSEAAAAETTIQIVYRSYYARMGGTGTPPLVKTAPRTRPMTDNHGDNVTPFRKIKPEKPPQPEKRKLPVALIFIGLVVLAVLYNYVSKGMI